jgi:hypothetical protein
MNRGDLDLMRQRLASRGASMGADHPLLLWVAAILWAVVAILFSFI